MYLVGRVPHTLFPDLVSAFVPPDTQRDEVFELVISIDDKDIPTRDFAEYLSLVDRLYGRLSGAGFMSYSHREWGRLNISEINRGSLQTVFQFAYDHLDTAIIIFVFLKGLPRFLKVSAEAYKTYEEGRLARADRQHKETTTRYEDSRLARENRRQIREEIEQESGLAKLDDARKTQLTTLLDSLLMDESPRLTAPKRFARRKVQAVWLRIKGQKPPR